MSEMKRKILAALAAVAVLFGIGATVAPAAHAENIVSQFVASKTAACGNSTIVYSAVIQVTDLVRYRVTYIRAQVMSGTAKIHYYFFSTNSTPDGYAGYWGPGNAADTQPVAWPTPWKQNPPFVVDGQIGRTDGIQCPTVRIYG